jgi:N-acetyltransferase
VHHERASPLAAINHTAGAPRGLRCQLGPAETTRAGAITLILEGHGVRLEPLAERHRAELREASDDPEVWRFAPEAGCGTAQEALEPWLTRSLAQAASGLVEPFAVRALNTGALLGSTRYLNLDPANRRLEIGNTWYGRVARGTWINPACKLLMLEHAFTARRCVRVEFKCDARNGRSRAALAKLGATLEGTLRKHLILGDGFIRDTVYFSVLEAEWLVVREMLLRRVESSPG